LQIDFEIARVELQGAHVGVEVSDVNTGLERAANLSARFEEGLFRSCMGIDVRDIAPKITCFINQPGHLVTLGNRTPSVLYPFGSVAEMNAEILLRMRLCIGSYFRKPRARDHNGG
jgi:hypothetical protein